MFKFHLKIIGRLLAHSEHTFLYMLVQVQKEDGVCVYVYITRIQRQKSVVFFIVTTNKFTGLSSIFKLKV